MRARGRHGCWDADGEDRPSDGRARREEAVERKGTRRRGVREEESGDGRRRGAALRGKESTGNDGEGK
jgi:hypothetical protein